MTLDAAVFSPRPASARPNPPASTDLDPTLSSNSGPRFLAAPALSHEGFTLLHPCAAHLLSFQSSTHSLCVYPEWHQERFSCHSPNHDLPLTPLEATLTRMRGRGVLC